MPGLRRLLEEKVWRRLEETIWRLEKTARRLLEEKVWRLLEETVRRRLEETVRRLSEAETRQHHLGAPGGPLVYLSQPSTPPSRHTGTRTLLQRSCCRPANRTYRIVFPFERQKLVLEVLVDNAVRDKTTHIVRRVVYAALTGETSITVNMFRLVLRRARL